jgi:hypothetical protein
MFYVGIPDFQIHICQNKSEKKNKTVLVGDFIFLNVVYKDTNISSISPKQF